MSVPRDPMVPENDPVPGSAPMRRRRFVRVEAIAEIFANAPAVDVSRLGNDLDALADQNIAPHD